jgi:hypothetical protein
MYAVAASSERDVLPLPVLGRYSDEPHAEPCGVRHAVATMFCLPAAGQDPIEPSALCGAELRGWRIFPDYIFDPSHGAACQRCAQLFTCLGLQEQLGGVRRPRAAAPRRANLTQR